MYMVKGYNSDLSVRGKSYHVQTEDWGLANPFLVSRIFRDGAVILTMKTSHQDALTGGPTRDAAALEFALRRQHQTLIEKLHSGEI